MVVNLRRTALLPVLCVAMAGICLGIGRIWWEQRLEHSQDRFILAAANVHGVDPALVKAVVWRESRFNPRARGGSGELGLMQVGELAGQEWADAQKLGSFQHEHLLDPATNTLAGAWYLAKLIQRYPATDNAWCYALADYNAGRSNVLRWSTGAGSTNSAVFLQQMTYPGTRAYIESILRRFKHYEPQFQSPAGTSAASSS